MSEAARNSVLAAPVSVVRQDVRDFMWDTLTDPVVTTEEGFLRGRAVVTNIGVFPYLLPDGTVRRELRLPDEVFHPDSLASLKMKPVTLDHPAPGVKVTPENAKDLVVGSIGDNLWTDAFRVYAPITITHRDAIEAVQGGKQALSCGYTCELEFSSGVWMGVAYDAIQRNIRYNHVALVDRGRAGDDAVLRMDAAAGIYQQIINKESTMSLKTIRLDGVSGEFQADEAVIARLEQERARADKAEKALASLQEAHKADISRLEGERDSHRDRADKAEAALKELRDGMPAAIQAAVTARVGLLKAAQDARVEITPEHSDADIMTAIVLKAFPKADAEQLKQPAYLKARFDAAVELLQAQAGTDMANRQAAAEIPAGRGHADTADKYDACAAQRKMAEELKNAWKK